MAKLPVHGGPTRPRARANRYPRPSPTAIVRVTGKPTKPVGSANLRTIPRSN